MNALNFKVVEVPLTKLYTFPQYLRDYNNYSNKAETPEKCKYGYYECDDSGNVTRVVDRTNPNARWDWYVVGGRWSRFFQTTPDAQARGVPARTDQCCWGDVDFEAERARIRTKAEEHFSEWSRCLEASSERPKTLQDIYKEQEAQGLTGKDLVTKAREIFFQQEAVKLYGDAWDDPVELFGFDRAAYVDRQVRSAYAVFAIVKDGKWYQRGDMGWFGTVHGEKPKAEWEALERELLEGLSPDTIVTLVDCHI